MPKTVCPHRSSTNPWQPGRFPGCQALLRSVSCPAAECRGSFPADQHAGPVIRGACRGSRPISRAKTRDTGVHASDAPPAQCKWMPARSVLHGLDDAGAGCQPLPCRVARPGSAAAGPDTSCWAGGRETRTFFRLHAHDHRWQRTVVDRARPSLYRCFPCARARQRPLPEGRGLRNGSSESPC